MLLMVKWFINCVLPGVADIFASLLLLQSMLISDDLPTLLLPMNANSGLSGSGHLSKDGLLVKYFASFISINWLAKAQRCTKSLNWRFVQYSRCSRSVRRPPTGRQARDDAENYWAGNKNFPFHHSPCASSGRHSPLNFITYLRSPWQIAYLTITSHLLTIRIDRKKNK